MNRIFLVRHGENWANITKEFSHHKVDYPLTPKGILQAQQTAQFFAALKVDAVYSSPLKRAMQTAAIIAGPLKLPFAVLEDFREVNTGDLEGQPVTADIWAVHDRIVDGWFDSQPHERFPGGENYFEVLSRFQRGLAEVTLGRQDQTIVVVAHGGIVSFTLKDICPAAQKLDYRHADAHNCSITEILLDHSAKPFCAELVCFARADHLQGEAAQVVSGVASPHEFMSDGSLREVK